MYKYQLETLEELEKTFKILESKTEDRMSFRIGFFRNDVLSLDGTKYIERTGELFICLNQEDRYKFIHDYDGTTYSSIPDDAYLSIRKNIFLELNEFIEKIFTSEKEKREFCLRLKQELEALNKAL